MFAVPGWSVSNDALILQTEPNQPAKQDDQSKKRKRGNENVTKKNVDQMYRQHIEGQKSAPVKNKKAEKKQEQKPKSQDGDVANSQKPQDKNNKKNAKQNNMEQPKQPAAADTNGADKKDEGDKPNKKQKKNNKNKKNKPEHSQQEDANNKTANEAPSVEPMPAAQPATEAKLTPLQQAMRQKLISSRFRHLNETLYTTPSTQALELFSSNPELFDEYHAGFSRQVQESWPSNPVDGYIQTLRSRGGVSDSKKGKFDKKRSQQGLPLPRRPNGTCTIADLGCGDAQLARGLTSSADKLNLKFLSYDLHAGNEYITKADITNLPVKEGSVDIAIFCLSLMGTNWVSFVEEAWRVLRSDGKGECWVSEVKSRFGKVVRKKGSIGSKKPLSKTEKKKLKKKQADTEEAGSDVDDAEVYAEDARPTDNDETDISSFVEVFRTRGFVLKPESVDKSNKMFVKVEFVKQGGAPTKGKHAGVSAGAGVGKKKFVEQPQDNGLMDLSPEEEASVLKPCVYKNR